MTATIKAELSRLAVTRTSERKAEVAALLRCADGVHLAGGRVVIEADLDTASAARRSPGTARAWAAGGMTLAAHNIKDVML